MVVLGINAEERALVNNIVFWCYCQSQFYLLDPLWLRAMSEGLVGNIVPVRQWAGERL